MRVREPSQNFDCVPLVLCMNELSMFYFEIMNVSELVRQHTNIQSNLMPHRLGDLGWPLLILTIVIFKLNKMSHHLHK